MVVDEENLVLNQIFGGNVGFQLIKISKGKLKDL